MTCSTTTTTTTTAATTPSSSSSATTIMLSSEEAANVDCSSSSSSSSTAAVGVAPMAFLPDRTISNTNNAMLRFRAPSEASSSSNEDFGLDLDDDGSSSSSSGSVHNRYTSTSTSIPSVQPQPQQHPLEASFLLKLGITAAAAAAAPMQPTTTTVENNSAASAPLIPKEEEETRRRTLSTTEQPTTGTTTEHLEPIATVTSVTAPSIVIKKKSALKRVSSYGLLNGDPELDNVIPISTKRNAWKTLPAPTHIPTNTNTNMRRAASMGSLLVPSSSNPRKSFEEAETDTIYRYTDHPPLEGPLHSPDSPSTNTLSTSSPTMKRNVSFAQITVRDYEMTVGDNPACNYGTPVSLDWHYIQHDPLCVDSYEDARPVRRNARQMHLNSVQRHHILALRDFSDADMQAAKRALQKVQRQRAVTSYFAKYMRVEDALESAARKAKRFVQKNRTNANKRGVLRTNTTNASSSSIANNDNNNNTASPMARCHSVGSLLRLYHPSSHSEENEQDDEHEGDDSQSMASYSPTIVTI